MGLNRIRETKEGQCVRSGACKQNFYDVILSGLHSHNYQEPNLGETVSGEEERGNLACVGAAWVQLGEGSCPQREIETGYFWACPPVPSLTYNHASSTPFTISAHPSSSTTAGPSCTVPIRTSEFMVSCLTLTDGRREVGGSLRMSYAEENGCIACCPLISPACNCAGVGVCSGCRRMRDEGVNCL